MLAFTTMGAFSSRVIARPCATTSPRSIHEAESSLLSSLTTTPYIKRQIRLSNGHILNTLSAGSITSPPLLLLHGWGGGLALFGRNLDGLSRYFRVHLVDLLGFGASSRPTHRLDLNAEEAEAFFVEPIVEWIGLMGSREGFSNLYVVGHSMGGFIAAGLKLQRPDLIRQLVLVCPIGVPKKPLKTQQRSWWVNVIFMLWEWGWTPQILIRYSGNTLGRMIARWMILKRFLVADNAREQLVNYFYEISRARASGEHAICTVLQSGAWARRPLCERLRGGDVTFLYAEKDWIGREAGLAIAGERGVKILGGGHHCYFERVEEFDRQIVKACLGERVRQ